MKVLTVSRFFPAYHPRKGEPTAFPEKIMAYLADKVPNWRMKDDFVLYDWHTYYNCTNPKLHTIRAGNRWKEGECASLRVWSDRPRRSRQIEFARVQLKRVIPINIFTASDALMIQIDGLYYNDHDLIAQNDGLTKGDLYHWFLKSTPFTGQILCWGDVKY